MKRGQIEMIGLVFIVILLVVGVFIYVSFSGSGPASHAQEVQGAISFLVAVTETTVPGCEVPLQRVAAACIEGRSFCGSSDPCVIVQDTLDLITANSIDERGLKYHLRLLENEVDSTGVEVSIDCDYTDFEQEIIAAPSVPIVLSGGRGNGLLQLAVCS